MKYLEPASKASQLVQCTLELAGFVVHPDKSVWKPTQRLVWLGFVVNTFGGQIEVPESKIAELRSMLEIAKQSDQVRAKFLASILGKIMSVSLAFRPVT